MSDSNPRATANASSNVLEVRFGSATAAENLRHAIETGEIIEAEDGTLRLKPADHPVNAVVVSHGPPLGCAFLMYVLFRQVYAQSAVPYGCKDCYKVKVVFHTLRELVAGWTVAQRIACRSKWGVDLDNPYSQSVYAGYFYTDGLDAARAVYKVVRDAFDADPLLGPAVAMSIKRGCSEYEAALGPSDRYEFRPELVAIESALRARFRSTPPADTGNLPLAHWIDVAFRIGDDTYLDFTGGKPLRPKTVSYDPAPPAGPT